MTKALQTALINIRRSPYQSLMAIAMMSCTWLLGYLFAVVLYTSHNVLNYFETSPQVTGFFELGTDQETIQDVLDQFSNREDVATVTLTSQEEALKLYREFSQSDQLMLDLVTADILPASIELSSNSLENLVSIEEELLQIDSIDTVVLQRDFVAQVEKWIKALRWSGITFVLILGTFSLLMIVVIISMKVAGKKQAIGIMRLLGANNWFISGPFLWEGIVYGLVSACISWALQLSIVLYLTPEITAFLGSISAWPLPPLFFGLELAIGCASAIILGCIASQLAVNRVLRT